MRFEDGGDHAHLGSPRPFSGKRQETSAEGAPNILVEWAWQLFGTVEILWGKFNTGPYGRAGRFKGKKRF